ncbi:MAG: CpsD/CapB family tyrosine-protein kinase [Acidobacteriota bacterium]|nr:CpsD/CapB family tyrosine-protein kinase [Acidobacteriota bacterium]
MVKLIKRKLAVDEEIVMLSQPRSLASERFRRLKTMLVNDPEESPQVIVVTSGAANEGKSLVSINLALAFAADTEGETLLIDADLRRPTVDRRLSPEPKLGLHELLTGRTVTEHTLIELQNTPLRILPAGGRTSDPVELLASEMAKKLITSLRERFTRIIIDTPPIVPFTDADVVGSYADGILVVARAGRTRRAMLQQAIQSATSTRVIGAVLNDATYSLADREGYYHDREYYRYYDRGGK